MLHTIRLSILKQGFKVVPLLNQAIQSDEGGSPVGFSVPSVFMATAVPVRLQTTPLDYRNEEGLGELILFLSCSLWDTMRPSASSRRKNKTPTRRPPVPSKSPQTPKKSHVSSEKDLFSGLPSFKRSHYSNRFNSVSRLALLVIIYKIHLCCK